MRSLGTLPIDKDQGVMLAVEGNLQQRVTDLITDDGEYRFPPPFDWVSEGETRISEDVKTEDDFLKLREMERDEHIENLRRADAEGEDMRGFYIRKAGECLEESNFWSTERLQFTIHWLKGKRVFYVETDRHY